MEAGRNFHVHLGDDKNREPVVFIVGGLSFLT